MPRLSQVMIRAALVWLAIGYGFGGLVLFTKGAPLLPWLWALRGAHIHMLLMGWAVQLACGVAYWVLPRLDASGDRGDERVVRASALALNAGVVLGAVQSIASTWPEAAVWARWLLLLAGVLYAAAALLFACNAWPRVRPFGVLRRPQ